MSDLSVKLKTAICPVAQTTAVSEERRMMARLANGNEAAMCELLQQHGEMLSRLVGRLTAWHVDRDDILQEVLLSVWQKSGSYRGDGTLEGWLRRIAVNRCRNHFRAANSLKRLIERFARLMMPGDETAGPDPIDTGRTDEVHRALRELADIDRTALVLFYLEEMPGEEVASVLKVKLETLHVRLHRARQKLKHVIEAQSESVD